MPVAVMCCGCRSYLGKDGALVELGLPKGGLVPFEKIMGMLKDVSQSQSDLVGAFLNKESANAAALKAGWSVEDAYGPNHRCPACFREEQEKLRNATEAIGNRGAFVSWPPQ